MTLRSTFMGAVFLLSLWGAVLPAQQKGGDGELRVAIAVEPQSLHPDLRSDDAAFIVCQNIYNKLVTLDADYAIIPDLARRWEISPDGLMYTFYLAPNVTWHDGKPFTAADVQWTFEAMAREKWLQQPIAARIAEIQAPDPLRVVMRLREPWAPFLPNLAWYGTFIMPRHLFEGQDSARAAAADRPIGTGPFRFVEWTRGSRIVLEANRQYFRQGPFVDKVIYRCGLDANGALDLLAKGEIDYDQVRPPLDRLPSILKTAGVVVKTFAHPARYFLGFNLRREAFADVRVRRAVNAAIDRTTLVEQAQFGYGAPAIGFYTPAVPWAYHAGAAVPPFDPAAAESLLDAAGFNRTGANPRLAASLLTLNASPYTEMAALVAEDLRKVGISVTVTLLPATEWRRRVFDVKDFDIAFTDGSWGPDPDNLALRFSSTGAQQFMGYASAEFDAAVAEGGRTADPRDRVRAYQRAQEILARDLPLAPLVENVQILLYGSRLSGLPQVEARGLVTFQDYSLVRLKRQ
jgi:peptide/nickel transport system substrate-binding protein